MRLGRTLVVLLQILNRIYDEVDILVLARQILQNKYNTSHVTIEANKICYEYQGHCSMLDLIDTNRYKKKLTYTYALLVKHDILLL
jgi:hypothetical protein